MTQEPQLRVQLVRSDLCWSGVRMNSPRGRFPNVGNMESWHCLLYFFFFSDLALKTLTDVNVLISTGFQAIMVATHVSCRGRCRLKKMLEHLFPSLGSPRQVRDIQGSMCEQLG